MKLLQSILVILLFVVKQNLPQLQINILKMLKIFIYHFQCITFQLEQPNYFMVLKKIMIEEQKKEQVMGKHYKKALVSIEKC